jgi:hypothetical protein
MLDGLFVKEVLQMADALFLDLFTQALSFSLCEMK